LKYKKTVDLGSTAKTFIAHKTKLDEYRTFSALTSMADKLKKTHLVYIRQYSLVGVCHKLYFSAFLYTEKDQR
jgi:hypothetical protein